MVSFRGQKKLEPRPERSSLPAARGLIQGFRRASPPLSYVSDPRGQLVQTSYVKRIKLFFDRSVFYQCFTIVLIRFQSFAIACNLAVFYPTVTSEDVC